MGNPGHTLNAKICFLPIKWSGREGGRVGVIMPTLSFVKRLAIMSLNCLEQCLTLNCFLKGSYNMLEKAWNQNPSKEPVRRGCVSRTPAVRSSIQMGTSGVVIWPAGLQMFTECSLLSRTTVEGLSGSLWAIKTCLLARRGDASDEGLWGSQVDHWHLRMEGWAFSMTGAFTVAGSPTQWEKAPPFLPSSPLQKTHLW